MATYYADGRAGEGKFVNLTTMRYDGNIGALTASWKQIKTCSAKMATFCNDYDGWETDVFDALGDYWSTSNGLVRQLINGRMGLQSKFLFPMCQTRQDKWTAAIITSTIRRLDCMPSCQESSVSGKSLRHGCTTTLHEHPDTNHPELMAKGGWVAADNSSNYTIGSIAIHLRPMRALTGYHNINLAHQPPRLNIFGNNTKNLLEKLMDELHPSNLVEFNAGGRLRPLLRVIMATNLKNFNKKLVDLTVDNVAVAAIVRAASRCDVSLDMLKQWSTAIQDDFSTRNLQQVTPGAGLQEMYEHQSRMLAKLVSQNANLLAQHKELEDRNARLESKFDTLLRSIAPDPASPQAAAGIRRMREESGLCSTASSESPPRRRRISSSASQQAPVPPVSPLRRIAQMAASIIGGSSDSSDSRTRNDAVGSDVLPARNAASRSSSNAGGDGNKDSPLIGDVVYQLVLAGQVKPESKFANSIPPPSLYPSSPDSSEMNKYRHAMRVVDKVISLDEEHGFDAMFQAAEPDLVQVSAAREKLNNAVVSWVLEQEGKIPNSRNNKARVSGMGNRVIKLVKANPNLLGTTQRGIVGFLLGQ
mmetsp:Transcript_16113/g.46243  ORF Transcript_16113/g.46243 Transcript_16113/m.46243 type:complete len:588 (-) Transcript_16113:47-1810(-)